MHSRQSEIGLGDWCYRCKLAAWGRLRSLLRSKDFDEYWDFHVEQERIRVHGVELENGPVLRLIDGGDSPSS
ncbi:MAG: hypothetical protein GY822_10270 [Deltaproteobacteria bacterium]|nr:hypothetical protein [Deltaproteobacteria bacterium]